MLWQSKYNGIIEGDVLHQYADVPAAHFSLHPELFDEGLDHVNRNGETDSDVSVAWSKDRSICPKARLEQLASLCGHPDGNAKYWNSAIKWGAARLPLAWAVDFCSEFLRSTVDLAGPRVASSRIVEC